MLSLTIANKQETQTFSHPKGSLELGRGPARPGAARFVIRDAFVSRDHLRVEEIANRKVRIENLSTKAPVAIDGHSMVAPGTAGEFFMPVRVGLGETTIDIDSGEGGLAIDDRQLRTVNAPVRGASAVSHPNLLGISQGAPIEEVVGWLETVVSVQKSSNVDEFYRQTANALVERIGLDTGLVLLRNGDAWKVAAMETKDDRGQGRAFSQTILRKVLAEKRTFYAPAATAGGGESLAGVQGVVASPFFDSTDEVAGIVYGTRMQRGRAREMGPLEAQVVQLLSAAVGAGLSRIAQDAEATRLRVEKEAAEEADRTKSRFLAMVSHELRTPLTTIIGYSEMLLEQVDGDGHSDYVPDLKQIHTSAHHLLTLINDILDLSKIEAGKLDVGREPFDPSSLIRDLMMSLEPLAKKNSNQLAIDCPPDLGKGLGDATRIRQCVINLVGNACKFTSNGTVTVVARRLAEVGTDYLTVAVTDTGIGMSKEQMDRLFQPFTQVDSSSGRKYGGTGLGLAISQKLSHAMGGDITVASEAGKGSTFTLKIRAELA